jgi:hypothetical protein
MDIRKIIKEQLQKLMEEDSPLFGSEDAVVGAEILNHFPFNKLPETRAQVDWSNRGVPAWGDVQIPSIDGNGLTSITSKDDIIGGESWSHPKTGHVTHNPGYIALFKQKYGEEPRFLINPTAPWYGKITVLNAPYLKAKDMHDKGVQSFGTEGD